MEPPVLQAEQSQLLQPFPTGEVLQALQHLGGPTLDSLQYVHISSVIERNDRKYTRLEKYLCKSIDIHVKNLPGLKEIFGSSCSDVCLHQEGISLPVVCNQGGLSRTHTEFRHLHCIAYI